LSPSIPGAGHDSSGAARSAAAAAAPSIIDNRLYLLLMLFGASLVLGLPLLWYSRAYGWLGKTIVTLLLLVWTVIVFALFWWSLSWSLGRLRTIVW
jgi:hypothetical protein